MRLWETINKNEVVLYDNKQWRVIEMIKKEKGNFCKIESIDSKEVKIVAIYECKKME